MATYDYASKGLANGVGIPALVLGSLGFLQSGGLNGLLGGWGGGYGFRNGFNNNLNGDANAALLAKIGELESEIKSYQNTSDAYRALRNEHERDGDRVMDRYIAPMAKEIADNRVSMARQEEQIKCLKEKALLREQIMEGKIEKVAMLANSGISGLQGQLNCLSRTVDGITRVVVPNRAVCPGWGEVTVTPTPATTGA